MIIFNLNLPDNEKYSMAIQDRYLETMTTTFIPLHREKRIGSRNLINYRAEVEFTYGNTRGHNIM